MNLALGYVELLIYSKLSDPTELQLVRVGFDFIFTCHKKEDEGRRKEGMTPPLALTRRNGPSCLKFDGCVCLDDFFMVSLGCLRGIWRVFFGCLNGGLGSLDGA